MPATAVTLKNITKRFGARTVLSNFSLDVLPAGSVCLLGPSGTGKTTVLRLIAGLDLPDEGEVWLNRSLASSPTRLYVPPADRHIGFVFQDLALWPHMTVRGNLGFVLASRRWPSQKRAVRIEQMLEMIGMRDRASEYPVHLSGGEQQRVALARALVAEPDLLLLDEPLSSLDPKLRAVLRGELATIIKRTGVTMIYVTHDRSDVDAFGGAYVALPHPRMPIAD